MLWCICKVYTALYATFGDSFIKGSSIERSHDYEQIVYSAEIVVKQL